MGLYLPIILHKHHSDLQCGQAAHVIMFYLFISKRFQLSLNIWFVWLDLSSTAALQPTQQQA